MGESETRRELFHLSCGQSPLRATADWRIFLRATRRRSGGVSLCAQVKDIGTEFAADFGADRAVQRVKTRALPPLYTAWVNIPIYPHRQPKDRRLKRPPKMRLMPRDVEVLKAVYEYRVMTHTQLTQLVFGNNHPSVATKRLYALYHNGYLERLFLPVRGGVAVSPTLYLLGDKGAQELALRGDYLNFYWSKDHLKVGTLFLAHSLAISDFRLKLTLACRAAGIPLLEWRGERELKKDYDKVPIKTASGSTRSVPIIPDGYFVLQTAEGKRHFALELDRGTMEGKRFRTKVEGYTAYFESGAYTERFGTKSLRVLTVTESQRRMKNLKNITERAGGKSRFWFASLDALSAQSILFEPAWYVAGRAERHALLEKESVDITEIPARHGLLSFLSNVKLHR